MAGSGGNRFEILCATSQPPDAQASLRHAPVILCAKPSMISPTKYLFLFNFARGMPIAKYRSEWFGPLPVAELLYEAPGQTGGQAD